MPSPKHWISPRWTGRVGLPSTKQEMMSVPPLMDERHRSDLMDSYTKSKLSGASGDPVESMVPSASRS